MNLNGSRRVEDWPIGRLPLRLDIDASVRFRVPFQSVIDPFLPLAG
jgi:hypothetical protein